MGVDISNPINVLSALTADGIEPIDGHAYTLYECGHAFDVEADPSRILWYASVGRALRSCPICDKQKLLTKYKQCGCGKVQISFKVQPSTYCNFCPPDRKDKDTVDTPFARRKNGHLADYSRGFCVHRNECLKKYIDYDTVPCKNCDDYLVIQGEHDALAECISG